MVVALSELPGIAEEDIVVNLERDAFTLAYDPALVNLENMYQAIRGLGYSPGLEALDESRTQSDTLTEDSPLVLALEKARGEGKLVFADFSAEWCIACKVLEQTVLSDPDVQQALEAYVFVDIDMDTYPQEASVYQVVGMPTLLVLNADGEELFRSVGLIEVDALQQELSSLVGK